MSDNADNSMVTQLVVVPWSKSINYHILDCKAMLSPDRDIRSIPASVQIVYWLHNVIYAQSPDGATKHYHTLKYDSYRNKGKNLESRPHIGKNEEAENSKLCCSLMKNA